ncbi:SusC/RagA family TonB-linked outer membrane protein [Chitinophaga arvensicola]|uniref:TonB-linked outer membrane protein, SusC/RagA family n=1 Tax=Chitinophaga arvensicola TaxID=29529 RepID=A0A1I0S7R5_9BACT|nr:TonB-dependent receptor [Chitinophaga arvensicola]SEW51856.1 TonB-linked outer membrane protein, SusC/RagA family [Chitinophaga arvensicola]
MTKTYAFLRKGGVLCLRKFHLVRLKIFCASVLVTFFMTVTAQGPLNKRISINLNNEPLTAAIKEISKAAGVNFTFGGDVAASNVRLTAKAENETLKDFLNRSFLPKQLTYLLIKDEIVISLLKEEPPVRQQRILTGRIYDNENNLAGATVQVEGTSRGAVTDQDGKYTLQINNDNEVLIFTFIGYLQQKMTVGKRTTLDVKMGPDPTKALNEVQIVAFGTQKKESVIGAITTINPKELKVPSSNLTSALAGRLAGIIAYQRSGEPGADNADFFVRGITTFGNNTRPLILIDGIELTTTDLARLQPDDIASFSVMKDATATALYGARGANGVILVTTKQGAVGKAKISLRLENSVSTPTKNIELADPVTFMKLHNEAVLTRDPLGTLPYTEEKIANTTAGKNPLVYPANNWREMLFKNYTMNQRVNLNVSGGGGVARYYVAGSFNKDNGILKVDNRNNFNNNIDLKNYSLRANVNINVTSSTELIVRLSGSFDDYKGPIDGGSTMYRKVMAANPVLFPAYFPQNEKTKFVRHIMFGNFGDNGEYLNPYADMVKGYKDQSRSQMLAQFELKQDLSFFTKGLSFRTMVNTNRTSNFEVSRNYDPFWYRISNYDALTDEYSVSRINQNGTEYLGYREGGKVLNSTFYMESMMNYNREFQKHGVSGLLVFITRQSLNANAGDLQLSLPYRNVGLSGRATYAYDNRYFTEFNFGYNGSERFYKTNRYGFFPSGGVAWAISNERFFDEYKNTITNLRLRYSYGLVGNDQIGRAEDRFFYLSNVDMNNEGRGATFGRDNTEYKRGVFISRYANEQITWEKATKQNLALEVNLWSKLNFIAEYYTEYRRNILMDRSSIPTTMGLSSGIKANLGEASGKGVDLSLDYRESWSKDLWASVRANFTYATSKYRVFEEPQYAEPWRYRVGTPLNQNFGFIAERLFIDDKDARNSPRQDFGAEYGGGDIKYLDVNGDGRITNADQVPLGFPLVPQVIYGAGFSAGYKQWDISAFFQGAANQSFWIDPVATAPFKQDGGVSGKNNTQLLKAYADSHWSEDNQDIYAIWPRLSPTVNNNNTQPSTWFMRNGSFVRLKQVEIGYSFSARLQRRLHTNQLRLYVNGTNLLLFSKFKLWDVEMAGNGLGYPIQRVFNIGANIVFN